MGRTIDNRNIRRPKPVKRIELSDKNTKRRLILTVALLLFGIGMLVYAFVSFLGKNPGWQEIQVSSSADTNCGDEFVFLYCLGGSGVSATAENKAIVRLYSEAAVKAYRLFNNDGSFDGVTNIYDINRHPNEVLQVDEVLYQAFSLMERCGRRDLYLAPVYSTCDNIFYCQEDAEIVNYDPRLNADVRAFLEEVLAFIQDEEAVYLELLGDGAVRLHVSEAYLAYAQENGVTDFIDFFWMKNAFIIDYLADVMIANGYTLGSFSSYDGFVRNLDASGTAYSFNIYDRVERNIRCAAVMQYSRALSLVYLRNYPMNSLDTRHYYELDNGEIRTPYIALSDGYDKSAVNSLVSYSDTAGCAEILMRMIPLYIADRFQEGPLWELGEEQIYSIYCKDNTLFCNDASLVLINLYEGEGIRYTASFVE